MEQHKLSRRGFLRAAGTMGVVTFLTACTAVTPTTGTTAPSAADQVATDVDFSNPQEVAQALESEGAEVSISSWGWSGLAETHFIPKFAEHTEKLYGVPVKLNWVTGVFDNALRELPVAGKTSR
jgi:nitrous oxide reductase